MPHVISNYSDLPPLNLPPLPAERLRLNNNMAQVYDPIRRKWLCLTPEEWVRQHFVNWMTNCLGYSPYRIANETAISFNRMARRCDTVIFDRHNRPCIIIEYKAPQINISQKVFDQIVRYNMVLKARYLIVSNGLTHYCCEISYEGNGTYRFIREIPSGAVTDK